jgi:hypothetical protein
MTRDDHDGAWTWRTVAVASLATVLLAAVLLRLALHPLGRVVVVAVLIVAGLGLLGLLARPAAYPRTRVGIGTRVTASRIEAADDSGTCVACGDDAAGGVRRRFVREAVVAGVPLVLLDDGENRYCPACAGEGAAPVTTDRPAAETEAETDRGWDR